MIRPAVTARRIGTEAQPIAIIDGFHPDPDALRELVHETTDHPSAASTATHP